MKRIGYLYNDMLDKNLIRRAINKALIHKEKTKYIVHILDNKEEYVDKYYNKLVNEEHKFKLGYFKTINSSQKNINIFLCRSYMSLRGWLVHCDIGRKFLKNHEPPDFYNKIKNYISKRDKENMNYEKLCKGY